MCIRDRARSLYYSNDKCCESCGALIDSKVKSFLCEVSYMDLLSKNFSSIGNWLESVFSKIEFAQTCPYKRALEVFRQKVNYINEFNLSHLSPMTDMFSLDKVCRNKISFLSLLDYSLSGMLFILELPFSGFHSTELPSVMKLFKQIVKKDNFVIFSDNSFNFEDSSVSVVDLRESGIDSREIVSSDSGESERRDEVVELIVLSLECMSLDKTMSRNFSLTFNQWSNVCSKNPGAQTIFKQIAEILTDYFSDKSKETKVIVFDKIISTASKRSTVATLSGVAPALRKLYANTVEAKIEGVKASDFSSSKGNNARLDPSTLMSIRWKGFSFSEVLKLPISKCCDIFAHVPKIGERLVIMNQIGLGDLCLGQSAESLETYDMSLVKLVSELGSKHSSKNKRVFLLEDPFANLSEKECLSLFKVFHLLTQNFGTIVTFSNDPRIQDKTHYRLEFESFRV